MSEEMTAHTDTMASQCDDLRSSIQTIQSTQGAMEGNIEQHELSLKAIEQTFNQFKTSQEAKLTMLIKDFSEFKEAIKDTNTMEHQHKDRIEYLKRKQEICAERCAKKTIESAFKESYNPFSTSNTNVKLKNGPFHISPQDELDIRKEALRAVEKKNEAIQEIQEKQEEVIELIKETHETKRTKMSEEMTAHTDTMASQCDDLRSSIQTIQSTQGAMEGNIEQHELSLKAIEQTFNQFKTSQEAKLTMLIKDFSEFKEAIKDTNTMEHQHKDRIEYLKRKQELQTKLCEMYKRHIESIPLSPILDGLDATVDDLFVELVICDDKTHKGTSESKEVDGYKDIFLRTSRECKNQCKHVCNFDCEKDEREVECKNIYVIGDAGMGKTTWCMKILNTWVDALMTADKKDNTRGKFSDANIMSKIDLLYFVSLRHAANDGQIMEMLTHQLFEEFPEMNSIAKDVFKREPHKCLIILDGLDEWRPLKDFTSRSSLQHPGLPGRQYLHGCSILTTTRPWKLDVVRLSNTDIDRAVKIQGLKNRHSLIRNIICHLNDQAMSEDDHKTEDDFVLAFKIAFNIKYVSQISIGSIIFRINALDSDTCSVSFHRIPLILVFMVCSWYDEGKLETTWAANFTGLIEFLIKIAEKNRCGRRPGRLNDQENLQELKQKWSESTRYLPQSLRKRFTNYSELILKLSKLAFVSLFDERKESSLVFTEESFENEFNPDELDVALMIGIISQSKVVGKALKRLSSLSFLHKSVQEYFTALFLVWKTENDDKIALNQYINYCRTTKDIKEMENVLMFVCGLSPKTASEMSRHVANVTQYDQEDHLDLKTYCVREMQAAHGPSYPSTDCPIFTFSLEATKVAYREVETCLELTKTNTKSLVSLAVIDTKALDFVSDVTQLQELTLHGIDIDLSQYDTLDLIQLRQLQTIRLFDINRTCIIRLNGSKIQHILLSHCRSVEIKTFSHCQISNETTTKEDHKYTCTVKDMFMLNCTVCKLSIEKVTCSINNVDFTKCNSCQFTMKGDVRHGVTKTGREQRSKIHRLVIDNSKDLTLDIDCKAEVEEVNIIAGNDYNSPVEDFIRQVPGFKSLYVRNYYSTSGMLPPQLEEIAIPGYTEWIGKMRNHSNIACIRIDGNIHKGFAELIEILTTLPKLKSFITKGTLTTQVLQTLNQNNIQRLKFKLHAHDRVTEILSFLTHMQSLRSLKLDNIDISYSQQLSHMLLRMSQLNTLKIYFVGIDRNNIDIEQHNQENLQELILESFSVNNRILSKAMIHYLQNCRHLKDLRCGTYLLKQLVLIPELTPILKQVETFKAKGLWNKASLEIINKMSNLRHVDLRRQCFNDFNEKNIYIVDMEHLESLKLYWYCFSSNAIFLSRQFVNSLPATRQPITIEISNCRLKYDVEQYLRSHQWLQSIERTVTYGLFETFADIELLHNIKILFWKRKVG